MQILPTRQAHYGVSRQAWQELLAVLNRSAPRAIITEAKGISGMLISGRPYTPLLSSFSACAASSILNRSRLIE